MIYIFTVAITQYLFSVSLPLVTRGFFYDFSHIVSRMFRSSFTEINFHSFLNSLNFSEYWEVF
ncbi:hypothetical protein QE422_001196 [Chryseobacterium sp. SORGH_AS 447]|nr:hypothetical protein [Chryseobacterium sp. SORGH_AS_0447]